MYRSTCAMSQEVVAAIEALDCSLAIAMLLEEFEDGVRPSRRGDSAASASGARLAVRASAAMFALGHLPRLGEMWRGGALPGAAGRARPCRLGRARSVASQRRLGRGVGSGLVHAPGAEPVVVHAEHAQRDDPGSNPGGTTFRG